MLERSVQLYVAAHLLFGGMRLPKSSMQGTFAYAATEAMGEARRHVFGGRPGLWERSQRGTAFA